MLGKYYRFHPYNDTDQTITYNNGGRIIISLIPWKMTSGAMAPGAEITGVNTIDFGAGDSVADGAAFEGAVIDNSANLYIGAKGTIEVTADADSTDGQILLYIEESTDNVVWPSDQADFDIQEDGIFVKAMDMSTDAVDEDRAKNFEI